MRYIFSLVILLILSTVLVAQTNKGGLSGTVTDPKGATVPGATVTITNVETNQSTTLTTSDSGSFTANLLDPVVYKIVVEAPSFKKSIVEKVKVDTASTATINIVLELGSVSEQVTIEADTPLLNSESGTAGQTITERQLQDVPLSNRSVLDLALTAPNVTGDVGSEDPGVSSTTPAPGFNLSLNGGRPGSTSILADGANNTGVGLARAVVSFTPETVQEFTVQTSAFSAEYGQTGGGVINLTTKSGTNRLTGTALWYTRNPATNAKVWGLGSVRPNNNLRYNQLSFSVGGPVFLPAFNEGGPYLYNGKDRTFFFVAAEPRYRRDFVTVDTLAPTANMRTGDFTGLTKLSNGWAPTNIVNQFAASNPTFAATQITTGASTNIYQQFTLNNGRLVPITLGTGQFYCQFGAVAGTTGVTTNAAGQPVCTSAYVANPALNVIPQAFINSTAVKGLQFLDPVGDYFLNGSGQLSNQIIQRYVQQDETRYTARIDHGLTASNKLNLRFTYVPAVGTRGFGSEVNGSTGVYSQSRQVTIGDTHIFTPTLVNDLRLNYTRGVFSEDFGPKYSIKTGTNLATELGLPSLTAGGLPLFNTNADGLNAFQSIGASGSGNNYNVEEQYGITDTVTWIKGNMSWKFGVQMNHQLLNVIPFFAASGGRWDFRVLNSSNNRTTGVANGGNVWASYLLGVPNQVLIRPSLLAYYYRWNNGAAFVQNDWKVRPNLTINLGLRYSLQMPRTEKYNKQGVFRPDLATTVALPALATMPAATQAALNNIRNVTGINITTASVVPFAFAGQGGRSKYLFNPEYLDFEPRFGFAWSPKMKLFGVDLSEKSVVIRGGYGISHAPLTGNNRLPSPDFGATVTPGTTASGSTGTANLGQPISFFNPPITTGQSFNAILGTDANGLALVNSLAVPGYALADPSGKVSYPYVQNWNVTLSAEIFKNTVLEIAYVGSKGTHLFLPATNSNPRDFRLVDQIENAAATTGINSDSTVADPLGRRDLSGNVLSVPVGSLLTQYLGFANLNTLFNGGGNSIRHGMYISFNRRVSKGLTFTSNYSFGKSIDDASDASPDRGTLFSGSTSGSNSSFGAPRSTDRAISNFDVKHSFAATTVYDLPFGKGRPFLKNTWAPLEALIGGWTASGVFRLQSGFPFMPSIADTNRLSANLTHSIRPDIVEGVSLINPRFDKSCVVSTLCEPYINPAAFKRPAKGTLGNAPRTLDVRGPMQRYFDFSLQKNFKLPFGWDGEGKRRLQFRVDLINAFNHPNFRIRSGQTGPNVFGSIPSEAAISLAEYNAWATFNGKPTLTAAQSATDPTFLAVQAQRTNNLTSGVLPANFFNVQLPEGFATTNANSFDISTLNGYKLYRLRGSYDANFGQFREMGQPRYIQFGLKLYF